MNNQISITLYQLSSIIKSTIDNNLNKYYLITAEIKSISENRSGHVYLELIEKNPNSQEIISQARATIWASTYRTLRPYFETTTGRILSSGMKVMLKVKVTYHEIYGLSLNIADIVPEYTIGELEMQRKQTIEQLKKDGVFDLNKQLEFPMLIKNIAVISSQGAAGYGDFIKHLYLNDYGYGYNTTLFNATMQGNTAEDSIIEQLDKIYDEFSSKSTSKSYDCVVIVRGGGSKTDLNCFDSYRLCSNICQFPIPVITGIGHDRDESIADMVAAKHIKTPTGVAQFFIDKSIQCENLLNSKIDNIRNQFRQITEIENYKVQQITTNVISTLKNFCPLREERLQSIKNKINQNIKHTINNQNTTINLTVNNIKSSLKSIISQAKSNLENLETKINSNSPQAALKRGFTYATVNGKIVMSTSDIKDGDTLTTVFKDGEVKSVVITINQTNNQQ